METAICSRIALSPNHIVNGNPGALLNQGPFRRHRRHAGVPVAQHHSDRPWPPHCYLACLRFRLHGPTSRLYPLICATGDGANSESNPNSSALPPLQDIQYSGSIDSVHGNVGLFAGMLGPDNDPLDREQAITMLWKYSQCAKKCIDEIVCFPGCLNLVTSLLKSKSSSTFEAAVGLLRSVSAYNMYGDVIAESGAIEEIFNLLCQPTVTSEVKEQTLCTLWTLSTDENLRERIAKDSMLPMFVNFLDDEELKVKEAAGGILANFALTLSLHNLMVEAGVIPKLADLLKNNNEGYKTIRKEAEAALLELSKDGYCRTLIIEEGLVRVPVVGAAAYSGYKSPTHLWPSFPDGTEIERTSTPSRYGASELLLGLSVCEENFNLQEAMINAIVGRSQQQFLARVGAIEVDGGRTSQLESIQNQQYALLPWIDGIARLVLILGLEDVSAITKAAHAIADASISEHMRISFKEAGAIRHLVQLLQHNSEVIQEAVACALDRLSLSHIVCKTLEKEGVLKPLISILEEPNTSDALLEKVTNILSRIFEAGSTIEMESYEEVIDGPHNAGSDEDVGEFMKVPYPSLKSKLIKRLQVQDRQGQPPAVLCFSRIGSEGDYPPEERQSSPSSNSKEAFDIKLPRRHLLVEFTCDSCGERTKRLINKVAYEKGTIFLQCAGCLVYHKFIDNLGLVVEYDLREEDKDSDDEGRR